MYIADKSILLLYGVTLQSYLVNTFIEFFKKYFYILVFLALEMISLSLLFKFNAYQGSVWFSAANSVVVSLNRKYGDVISFLQLGSVNSDLTARNAMLQLQNAQLRDALKKATHRATPTEQHIREVLKNYTLTSANVVSNSAHQLHNYLVIDKGEEDGITPEMGVVSGGGIVGITYLCGSHYTLIMPITNRKSSISCRIRGSSYFGALQWEGKSLLHAVLDDVPRHAKVKKGDIIETSGYSAVFPPGIFVGKVTNVKNSNDGQSYKLDVLLGTDFGNLRNILVVKTPYKAEIDTLKTKAIQLDEKTTTSGMGL